MSENRAAAPLGGGAQRPTKPTHPDASVRALAAELLCLAGYLPTPPDWYETALAKQYNAELPWLPVDFTPIRRPVDELQHVGARVALYAFSSCAADCIGQVERGLSMLQGVAGNLPANVEALRDALMGRLRAINVFATKWLPLINEDTWATDKADFLAEASVALVEVGSPYELAKAYRRLRHKIDDCIHAISPLPKEIAQATDNETAHAIEGRDSEPTTPETPAGNPGEKDEVTKDDVVRVYTNGVSDERIKQVYMIANNTNLTVNEKLYEIDKILPLPPTASARQLGEMLHVSGAAVQQTRWWVDNRKGKKKCEIEQRRSRLLDKAKRIDYHRDAD